MTLASPVVQNLQCSVNCTISQPRMTRVADALFLCGS